MDALTWWVVFGYGVLVGFSLGVCCRGAGMDNEERRAARELLESARVEWRRDYDAVLIGFIFGFLIGGLVVLGVWLGGGGSGAVGVGVSSGQ